MELQIKALKAASIIAPMNDVRDKLNTVLISKDGYIGATDGHCAIMIEDRELKQSFPQEDLLIPSFMVERVLRMVYNMDRKAETVSLFKPMSVCEFKKGGRVLLNCVPLNEEPVDIKKYIPKHCSLDQC